MDFSTILNYILYGISGFLFGIFASRYSVLSAIKLRENIASGGGAGLIISAPQIIFLLLSFFIFPAWFIYKTTTGGFVYCAALLYFFSKGYKLYIQR